MSDIRARAFAALAGAALLLPGVCWAQTAPGQVDEESRASDAATRSAGGRAVQSALGGDVHTT